MPYSATPPKPFTVRQLAERVKQELGSPKKEAA